MADREPEYRWRRREHAKQNQYYADHKRYEAAQNTNVEKIAVAIKGVEEKLDRAEDKKSPKNKFDRTWRRLEVIGLWLAAAVGIGAIIVGNWDASIQRDVMQGQLDEMRAEQRPWLEVINLQATKIVVTGNSASVWVDVTYKNVGHSPAHGAYSKGVIVTLVGLPDARGQNACKGVSVRNPFGFGPTIFPDVAQTDHVSFPIDDLSQYREVAVLEPDGSIRREPNSLKSVNVFFAGCVAYVSDGSADVHGTTFGGLVVGSWDKAIDMTVNGAIDGIDLKTTLLVGDTRAY